MTNFTTLSELILNKIGNQNEITNVNEVTNILEDSKESLRDTLLQKREELQSYTRRLMALNSINDDLGYVPTNPIEVILVSLKRKLQEAKDDFHARKSVSREALVNSLKLAIVKRDIINVNVCNHRIRTLDIATKDILVCALEEQLRDVIKVALDEGIVHAGSYAVTADQDELVMAISSIRSDIQSIETLLEE